MRPETWKVCGASLLVRVGSPMLVLLTCTPSLKEMWPGSTIEMRWQKGICDLYAGAVDQNCVLMDGNALPCQACFVNEYTERERNRMYGLAQTLPSCLSNKSMCGTHSKNIQVLGQLNHRCGMTSHTRSFKTLQVFVLLQSENWFTTITFISLWLYKTTK